MSTKIKRNYQITDAVEFSVKKINRALQFHTASHTTVYPEVSST